MSVAVRIEDMLGMQKGIVERLKIDDGAVLDEGVRVFHGDRGRTESIGKRRVAPERSDAGVSRFKAGRGKTIYVSVSAHRFR